MSFRIHQLSSTRNPLIQEIRSAAASGRPTESGLLVAEGPHLIEELLRSSWRVEALIVTPDSFPTWQSRAHQADLETIVLPFKTFSTISSTETTQGVLALARPLTWSWPDLMGNRALIVALDGLQDPGNAGTIIRSAEAFGATGVVFLSGSVRASNSKLMRASAGSLFRIPFREYVEREELLKQAADAALPLYTLTASAGKSISNAALHQPCVLIAGNEGAGASDILLRRTEQISIPMRNVESLNAGVACSIALFEASRQRWAQ